MTDTAVAVIPDLEDIRYLEAAAAPGAPARIRQAGHGIWLRIAAVVVLTAIAYGACYGRVVADAIAGSRTPFLLVVPALVAVIATGYRSSPRGVGDAEADWIIAALVGIAGFTGLHLLNVRMPTLAGLWNLPMLGVVLWLVCIVAVLFSVRHVAQMWALWLFALCTVTPLPYQLTTAALGGSEIACALVASACGAIAVFLAGRFAPIILRVTAALGCFAIAAAFSVVAGTRVDLLWTVVVVGGLAPVLATTALGCAILAKNHGGKVNTRRGQPHFSLTSLMVLTATALVLRVVIPTAVDAPALPTVAADWVKRAGLSEPTTFPFITRFLGPDSTLDRYELAGRPGVPATAVDVMTATNQATLDDLADAVWYPTSRPLDYAPADSAGAMPLGARVIYSDADTATDGAGRDWYAVTWMWRTGDISQRVTVITSQTIGGDQKPPPPEPLSLFETVVRPAMWVARQQPDDTGRVDPVVSRRAAEVVRLLVGHGGVADETPAGA